MNMTVLPEKKVPAVIKVIGAGGGGGNAVNRMIDCNIKGVDFIALNTDAQALDVRSKAPIKIYIGEDGQGAGGDPSKAEKAAIDDKDKIIEAIRGAHLLFVTAGMGGGTGTGAAPVIAGFAREMGILTVGVVTKPFEYEAGRMEIAEAGIEKLKENVDSYIVIDNEKIMQMDDDDEILNDFIKVDDVLRQAIQGIIDVIYHTGNINVDFADIKSCLKEKGRVHLAIGKAEGANGVVEATTNALNNELLESSGIDGAKNVLVNIQGSSRNLKRSKINEAMNGLIKPSVDKKARVFWGLDANDAYEDEVSVTLMATGFPADDLKEPIQLREEKEPNLGMRLTKIENEESSKSAPPPAQMSEELVANGDFITGSEWSRMNKMKQPSLPGLTTKGAKKSYEDSLNETTEDFDFRLSSLPADSELEKPAIYRHKKK